MRRTLFALVIAGSTLAYAADSKTDELPADLTTLSIDDLMNIEVPTVTGATKYEQKTTEAPSSVTVITATEIKRYGHRTLADILQSVQGFHVSNDRNYSFLGTRGVSLGDFNSRVLVLIDGHRLNNNLTDGAFIGTAFLLDVDLIDRVEIIRGPGSVVYGNNAFFGVINVITREGKQLNGAEFSGEYASFDTYKGRVTVGKQFTNGVQLLLSGTLYDSDGPDRLFYEEYNSPPFTNGTAYKMDKDEFGSFFGSLSYGDFTLQGGFIQREKRNPTAQYLTTFNDPRLVTADERSYVALKYEHSFPDVVDVLARIYYDRSDFEIDYPVAPTMFNERQDGEWWGTELQLTKRLWDRHTISVGAEYRDDFQQRRRVSEPSTGTVFTDADRDRQSHGVFVQGDFAILTNRLHFNGGVRYDQYGDFDPSFNPRLALIGRPIPSATFKAIYGTAFRTPNFLELSDPRFQDIRSEEIKSYELIYEQKLGRYFGASLAGFHNRMDDLIVFGSGSFTNFDAETTGIEAALEGNWKSLRTRMSYTYQDTENRADNSDLTDSPQHLVKFNISVPVYQEKVFVGLEYQYTSSRHTVFTDLGGTVRAGEDAQGVGLVNLTLFSQDLIENLEFSASLYNVLDEDYGDPATRFHLQDILPRDGRTFRLKLTYRF